MYKRILVPIDLNDRNSWEKGFPAALSLAQASGAEIDVLTVLPDFGMSIVGSYFPKTAEQEATEAAKAKLLEIVEKNLPADVGRHAVVAHGRVYEQVLECANQRGADLIIMVSHNPELKDYLLGPNAARVARHASQSVMIVR